MFTQTLALKGTPPAIVFGLIKSRRHTKIVAQAWRLKSKPAVRKFMPALLTPPKFVKTDEQTMEEKILAVQEKKSRLRFNSALLRKAALAEQRTVEDGIEPRLRAKLVFGKKPDENGPRGWHRRKDYRRKARFFQSWKHRRKTKFRVVKIDFQQDVKFVQHLSY